MYLKVHLSDEIENSQALINYENLNLHIKPVEKVEIQKVKI